ncbi:MAG: hypothetical protein R3E90_02185 [Marinicella sp.]
MLNKPQAWLPLLPFIESHWPVVKGLLERFPALRDYDLNVDWQQFVKEQPHLDNFAKLRQFRQSRLAFMALQDFFLPLSKHITTMSMVSQLADFLLHQAWQMAQTSLVERYGKVSNQKGELASMQVFALGKLGTCELNYSSDIDLVFVHDGVGVSSGEKSLDAESWFIRFGKKIIQLLDTFTIDGRVYRVDMRLRPFGSAGPLVCSQNALIQYLISEGRDWERFAWMRARLVCGNEDAAQSLVTEVNAFIYRRHLDYKVFDALAKIKNDIALEHQVHQDDLKLGWGGIRTIEFIVQSLQVVFGGRIKSLQGVSIYPQFSLLLAHKKFKPEQAITLERTWLWLRKLENMAQIVNDQDTHQLPSDPQLQKLFAQLTDTKDWLKLTQQLKRLRDDIGQIFTEIFSQPDTENQLTTDQQLFIQQLLDDLNLSKVPRDTSHKAKQLLEVTASQVNQQVCRDFADIVKVLLKRPNYLLMLLKEQNVHRNVLLLLVDDPYYKSILSQYPVLFEQLFEYQPFVELNVERLQSQWHMLSSKESDTEQWMEQLRYFKLVNQFNLMRFYTAADISEKQFSEQLVSLAEFIFRQVVEFSFSEVRLKFPMVVLKPADLMVIAYGSMAVRAMKMTSDLDLVFVLDHQQIVADDRVFLHRLIKRIMHHLTSHMYHGLLYEIDLQLRPNGNSGPLITTREEFEHYQQTEAWTWEHAAIVKSRLVFGTKRQKTWYQQFRKKVLGQKRDAVKVDEDLQEMVEKLALARKNKAHEEDFQLLGDVLKYTADYPQLADVYDLSELKVLINGIKKAWLNEPG